MNNCSQVPTFASLINYYKYKQQVGAELGQAQHMLGLNFTSIEILLDGLTATNY